MKKAFLYTLTTALILGGASHALAQEQDAKPEKPAMFDAFDLDGDGKVSKEEFAKKREDRRNDRDSKMHKEIDTNEDGVISEDEFISKSRERFSKLDADADGKVTQDEAKAHRDAMREKHKEKREERKEKRTDRKEKHSE